MSTTFPHTPHLRPAHTELLDTAWRVWLWLMFVMLAVLALGACTATRNTPPPAPLATKVLVPVTEPCKVEKVDPSPLPSAGGVPDDIFEAVKRVLGDRAVLLADREKLVAANTDPCPEAK
jgi:hypothetical protein